MAIKYRFRKRHLIYAVLVAGIMITLWNSVSFTDHVMTPDRTDQISDAGTFAYDLPLDPASPWPKFRNNGLQNGRSQVLPQLSGFKPWMFKTGKGIFSSPVVDAQGTVYIGSADRHFYAIDEKGGLKWKVLTGEIIDSSALLDNRGRVFVGSGDAHVYAFERDSGRQLWQFRAHTPQEVTREFDIKTYNLDWFEGNIAMLRDGSILAPNDNYLIYRLDPETGEKKGQYLLNEMGWSLPAVNPRTGRLFTGSNFMALKNVFSFDVETGKTIWTDGGFGTNAASALLTSSHENGAVVIGGYDGILRAFSQKDGYEIWTFGTRDHIYASPAQLADGTLIQPSTDGTVYALDPETGRPVWEYDTKEPIRSSPAVDGLGRIYFGSGEGRLYCLNPNGTLRWAYQLIDDVRNDINSSPALGPRGIYIAGENGGIFFVPYDWPLSPEGKTDPKTLRFQGEDLPPQGTFLFHTASFGGLTLTPPGEIDANQPLCFTLIVRENGDTVKSAIDRDSVKVDFIKGAPGRIDTSANAQFLTLVPQEYWTGPEGGSIRIRIQGRFKSNLKRVGLKFFWGKTAGEFDQTVEVFVRPRQGRTFPYKVPNRPGEPASVIEISRLAPANPSILPSYNQIGYDSLHYILGAVEGDKNSAILWGVGGRLTGSENKTRIAPDLEVRFPMMLTYDRGLVTLYNYDGILLDMNGSWDMPIEFFRISGRVDPETGKAGSHAAVNAVVACDEIEFYGNFLKLLGMSEFDTGRMFIFGGADYSLFNSGTTRGPDVDTTVDFSSSKRTVSAGLTGKVPGKQDHVYSILLVDTRTNRPVPIKYIDNTKVVTDGNGRVTRVDLSLEGSDFKGRARVYYMVDTYPAARGEIEVD